MRATLALTLAAGLFATAAWADAQLLGQWIAISAERDGAAAPDIVGHRLTFADDGFTIVATDGTVLYAGSFASDATAKPATIDFASSGADAPATGWAGIWKRDGDMLTIVDNAPDPARPRPSGFAAPVGSGYVMVVFTPWS